MRDRSFRDVLRCALAERARRHCTTLLVGLARTN